MSTRDEIKQAAHQLAQILADGYRDIEGEDWTNNIFSRLSKFSHDVLSLDPNASCFHKRHPQGRTEFLWDLLALDESNGVLLVAESEQNTLGEQPTRALRHDFEKLFYVYAPLRVLILKARDTAEIGRLVQSLEGYMQAGTFNPGSIFLIHACLWNKADTHTYYWQSSGDPAPRKAENLVFERLELFS